MKRYLSVFLLSIYLLSATELSQLLRLPMLIEHYVEHKAENHDLTIFEFVHQHYCEFHLHQNTNEKDTKLPFKSRNSSIQLSFFDPISIEIFDRKEFTFIPISEYKSVFIDKVSSIYEPPIAMPPEV
jgi:hypothetical protein